MSNKQEVRRIAGRRRTIRVEFFSGSANNFAAILLSVASSSMSNLMKQKELAIPRPLPIVTVIITQTHFYPPPPFFPWTAMDWQNLEEKSNSKLVYVLKR